MKKVLCNWKLGVVSPNFYGSVNTEQYDQLLSKANNVILLNNGGIRNRPGSYFYTNYPSDIDPSNILNFFSIRVQEKYYTLIAESTGTAVNFYLYNYNDNIWETMTTNTIARENVTKVNIASGGVGGTDAGLVIIVCFETTSLLNEPIRLYYKQGWDIDSSSFFKDINQTIFFPETDKEDSMSDTRGWAQNCCFYQGRLYFANSKSLPNTIWGSRVYDFYSFKPSTADILPDDPVFFSVDDPTVAPILHIIGGKVLGIFTNSSYNNIGSETQAVTPTDSKMVMQDNIGSSHVNPIINSEWLLFINSDNNSLRMSQYNYVTANYPAKDANYLNAELFSNPIALKIYRPNFVDNTELIIVVNDNNTMAVFCWDSIANKGGWVTWDFQNNIIIGDNNLKILDVDEINSHLFVYTNLGIMELHFDNLIDFGIFSKSVTLDNGFYTIPDYIYNMLEGRDIFVLSDTKILAEIKNLDTKDILVGAGTWTNFQVGLQSNYEIETLPLLIDPANPSEHKRIAKTYLRLNNNVKNAVFSTIKDERTSTVEITNG